MSQALAGRGRLEGAISALRRDLLREEGPQISTMRNYRFALLLYAPEDEYPLRRAVARLGSELRGGGWVVVSISLEQLLLDRIRALGEPVLAAHIARERALSARSPERALAHIKDKVVRELEGPDGLAADVIRVIHEHVDRDPARADRMLVLLGRAGALYPFTRTSALLKHLDGHTRNVPVVLLYPGRRAEDGGLEFMGRMKSDRDYRPRIYE